MNNPNPWNIRPDVNFYHKDALGSITAITGKNGNVVEEYKYGAYGNPYQGRFLNIQKNNPYGFTGQRYEAELRMYSFAYRTYNPVSMRWMTQDPLKDGTNWYQYVSGDPVNLWDPLGLTDVVAVEAGGNILSEAGTVLVSMGSSLLSVSNLAVTGMVTISLPVGQNEEQMLQEWQKSYQMHSKDIVQNISRQKNGHLALQRKIKEMDIDKQILTNKFL